MVKNHPIYYPLYKNNDKDIILITGGRGCETPTQEVVMADMTIKQIKDIKVGDKVMGIDGTPRNVLDVHFGRGQMYKVSQSNADDYFVNDEHVLSLHKSRSAQTDKGRILKNGNRQFKNGRYPSYGNDIDMPIREYMAKSERFRYNFRGFKVKIPYKEQTVSIEPYLLGLWLGDGTCTAPYITNPDEEIRDYIKNYCSRKGQRFFSSLKSGAWQLGIRSFSEKKGANEFLNFLYDKNLIGNKYIPQEYIANSEQIRLQLLAGLVDTDGSYDGWGYEITQKNESLAKQIKFLADSLGFRTHIQTKRAYIGEKDCGLYWRISISGDLYRVPCRVKRKQAQRGDNYNDRTFTESSLKISDIGIGDWVGIELDGDKRYIHSDGTVTHNSGKSFAAGTFVERLSFELGENEGRKIAHQVLYTRYTMTSAQISVIPEFLDKVEQDGTGKYFYQTKSDVVNKLTGSRVMFRGIKTSSGNQTAKLKSIFGLTVFVVDEGEEWTSETEFETIKYSIRQKGLKNFVIIIMNPTDSNHFVYRKYIKDTHRIEYFDGVPVQISTHPNVLHIHTSYLDNKEFLSEQFVRDAQFMKETNPERYAHIFMGQWADVAEGAVFKKWGICKEFPKEAKKVARGLDFGYACFRGDTLIMTNKGEVPIKDIKAGDFVLTRKGYRRVRNKMYNGIKEVISQEIIVNGTKYSLSATYEHHINANGKWKKYGKLTKGDKLFVLSSLKEKSSSDTQAANTPTTIITSGSQAEGIIKSCYTTQSMNTTKELSLTEKSYTTKTAILSTTILATLWRSPRANITRFIIPWGHTLLPKEPDKYVTQKRTGESVGRKFWTTFQTKCESVKAAVRNLLQRTHIKDSALSRATTNGSTTRPNSTQQECANGVVRSFKETNISNPKPVATNAHITSHGITYLKETGREKCDVYDLEIDGVHEYFANSVLVHNCDPSACIKCGIYNNNLYLDEQFYKTGMLIRDLIEELKKDDSFVYADSADPRMIQEIANGGIIIYPVAKPAGSIVAGIERMKDFDNIYVTERSVNLQEEFRNYTWAKDKDGNYINVPIDAFNHGIDASRYYTLGHILGQIVKPKIYSKDELGIF